MRAAWPLLSWAWIARALWRAVRGRRDVGPGDVPLPYTDRIGLMLWTTVGLGVLETALVHLLVRQPTVRWVLLAVSLYGLLWLVGLACSLRQHLLLLDDGALVLRFAHLPSTRVPLTG